MYHNHVIPLEPKSDDITQYLSQTLISIISLSGVCDVSQCWRFVILSYAAFRGWNVRGLEDVSRCCKGLVLALRLRNVLVWLRMFAAKIVVPVWMLIIWFSIEELGLRCSVNLSMGRSVFLHNVFWSVGLPRSISCIFEDVLYSSRSFLTNFSLDAAYYG